MKLIQLCNLFFLRSFTFRVNVIIPILSTLLRFAFTVFFWTASLDNADSSFLYNKQSMLIYFFVVMIIGLFIETNVADKVSDSIFSGNLSVDLLKPISFNQYKSCEFISTKILLLIILFVLTCFGSYYLGFSPFFFVSLIFALVINYQMNFLIGTFAFWTNSVWGILLLNSVITDVFGGRLFPIDLADGFFRTVIMFLPYQYIYFVPSSMLVNKTSPIYILYQLAYIVFLYILCKVIFKKGCAKYEATGI